MSLYHDELPEKERAPAYQERGKKMPLIKSASKKAIGENIEKEQEAGKPHKQAIAIALNTARESGAHIPKKHSSSHHRHKEHR